MYEQKFIILENGITKILKFYKKFKTFYLLFFSYLILSSLLKENIFKIIIIIIICMGKNQHFR